MYYIVLCDDNVGFLDLFKEVIEKEFSEIVSPKHKIVFERFFSGDAVLNFAKEHKISVLFVDVDMPKMSGFELVKALGDEKEKMLTIFMSAYDNFVYESFDYSPFMFIRKSCIVKDLRKVVLRINDRLFAPIRTIELHLSDETVNVNVKNILYFESEKNYYAVHLVDGQKLIGRGTMNSLEEMVKELDFYRIHSGYIVNLEHIGRITPDGYLFMGTKRLSISQKRIKDFKKVYSEYTRRSVGLS